MSSLRCTNLRFNLDKDIQRKAWEYLQTMDKGRFKSYSQVIATALVDYFDRQKRLTDDPFFETREREERFVNQIVAAVESAMNKALPIYLAGCMAGLSQAVPPGSTAASTAVADEEKEPQEIDWDFLGA